MPRYALLTDIHANLPALKAVLEEVARCDVDGIFCGGDTVGYGANPAACVKLIREHGGLSVLGNHDSYTLQLRATPSLLPPSERETNPVWAGIAQAAETLDDGDAEWLASLPLAMEIPGAILAHAALHDVDDWPYLHSTRDAKPTFKNLRKRGIGLGFFGHTHRQGIFSDGSAPDLPVYLEKTRARISEGAICAVMMGSVGQPRDGDLRAAWVLWDSDERIVEFRHTPYPALEAAMDILSAGLPHHSALRLLDADGLKQLRRITG